jgi:hypothetical protein
VKVALIPPRTLENYALKSRFHLALAIPELLQRRPYREVYKRAVRLKDYVVLDNGLAEGKPCSAVQLARYAEELGCQELVLPDVWKDADGTVTAVTNFFKIDWDLDMKCMAVAQGQSNIQFKRCIEAFAAMPFVQVVGLPRHMLETLNRASIRIDIANWLAHEYPDRFEVHFLGTNATVWPSEVKAATKYAAHVRSVDTSMPFSYALAGERLDDADKRIIRPPDFFNTNWVVRTNPQLLRDNIATLMGWANASTGHQRGAEASTREVRDLSAEQLDDVVCTE